MCFQIYDIEFTAWTRHTHTHTHTHIGCGGGCLAKGRKKAWWNRQILPEGSQRKSLPSFLSDFSLGLHIIAKTIKQCCRRPFNYNGYWKSFIKMITTRLDYLSFGKIRLTRRRKGDWGCWSCSRHTKLLSEWFFRQTKDSRFLSLGETEANDESSRIIWLTWR